MEKVEEKNESRHAPVMMAEAYWVNSQLSYARYTGSVKCWGVEYVICDKRGHTIFECSMEAERAGRQKAIEPGEPADLVDTRYVKIYRKVGRAKFVEMLERKLTLMEMRKEAKL